MGKDPSSIRSEIAATRDRMDDTIDALKYKTDLPARLSDRIDAVKATVGDVASSVASRTSDAAASVASRAGDVSQNIATAVGAAVGTAQESLTNLVPGAKPSDAPATTHQHPQPEDDLDVQED